MTTENNQNNEDQSKPETTQAESRKAKVEAIRKEGIDSIAKQVKSATKHTDRQLDRIAKVIENNRGHIGGVIFILVPSEGTQLVDAEDTGVWQVQDMVATSPTSAAMLKMAMEQFTGELSDRMRENSIKKVPPGLESLLAHLEGRKGGREK